MSPVNTLFSAFEEAAGLMAHYTLGRDFAQYCDLRTVIGLTDSDRARRPEMAAPYIFVTDTGSYASVFELEGTYCEFNLAPALTEADQQDPSRFGDYIRHLHTVLASEFQTPGHKLSVVFERDPGKAREALQNLSAHQYRALKRMGLDLHDILDERTDKLVPFVARERAFLVVYSSTEGLPVREVRDEKKRLAQLEKDIPSARYGQHPLLHTLEGLKIRHDTLVTTLENRMPAGGYGVRLRLLDAHEVGLNVRETVEPDSTAPDWQPCLPDDLKWPHGVPKGDDHSVLLAPHLNYQLFNSEPEVRGDMVILDGQCHSTLALSLGPQRPETFADLFTKIDRHIPWRIRMDIMPGGMAVLGKKRAVLSIAALIPTVRPIYNAVEWLAARDKSDPVCVMTICAATWAKTPEETRRNRTLLQKGLQSWGVCEVTRTFGDPLKAWVATLPAARGRSIPALLYPPLSAALALLPLQRPATPWRDMASIIFQTPDGKPYPVRLASPLQLKFTEIVAGDSGSGKSVLLGALNEAAICGGQNALPYLSIVDKGFTAQGLVRLLRDSLPPHRRHEVAGLVLENSREQCKNPFDVQLGAKYPLTPETEYIINLCETLCVDPQTGVPPNAQDARQILTRVTEMAYERNADTHPVRYAPTIEPNVDTALEETGLHNRHDTQWWEKATWYEVRDMLFEHGQVQAATRAHYQAMPELSDLQSYLNEADIQSAFGTITRDGSGEALVSYIARCLRQALTDYKMFAGRTRFDISPDTRVLAVDLNNVVGGKTRAGHLKTGIMYLFAGQLAAGHFDLPQYRNELMHQLPAMYRPLHHKRLTQLAQEIKTKEYDELHNAREVPFVLEKLASQDLENRKFGIRTVLSSQYLNHFPDTILKSANSLYLTQVSQEDIPLLTKHFGVPQHTIARFRSIGPGASPDGSGTHFLACFRLKTGLLTQILKNTLGPKELWALNSTPKDAALRDLLYDQLDGRTARHLLAQAFPTGSAVKLIELREKQAGSHDNSNIIQRLADELIAGQGLQI